MVGLQRGVQSYLTAKSSFEQDGYESRQRTGAHFNAEPDQALRSPLATPKKFGVSQKVSRGRRDFFARTRPDQAEIVRHVGTKPCAHGGKRWRRPATGEVQR
jgi:hypothetical protein